MNIFIWVLRIVAAAAFLMAGSAKLSGNPMMVATFAAIGLGQWFRYLTGALEVAGALALLIPRLGGVGAAILTAVMVGAVLTHLLILGGNATPAIVLLLISATIAWQRRQDVVALVH